MYKKKLLLLSLVVISSINFCSQPESTEQTIPQDDDQETAALLANLPPEKIIKLLTMLSSIDKIRLDIQAQENELKLQQQLAEHIKAQHAAREAEANKPFSFTECGIVIRDTFFEEFGLRRFSLEFCENLVKNLKRIIMTKLINETFNGVDFAFGTLPARYIHENSGIYPMQFLTSGSLSEYFDKRRQLAQQEDPRVRDLHQQADQLLQEHNINQTLLDAQNRMKTVEKAVEEQNPAVRTIHQEADELLRSRQINLAQRKAEERLEAVKQVIVQQNPAVKEARRKYNDYRNHHSQNIAVAEEKAKLKALRQLIEGDDPDIQRGFIAREFVDFLRKDIRDALHEHRETIFGRVEEVFTETTPSATAATTCHRAPSAEAARSTASNVRVDDGV